MSVARAQREVDAAEFTEWVARDQLPGIHSRAEYQAGLLMAVIANIQREPKKRPKPFVPEDFFPRDTEPRIATNDDLMAMALAFQRNVNATLKH